MTERQSKAAKIAAEFSGDPKGLPKVVQETIQQVKEHSQWLQDTYDVDLAEGAIDQEKYDHASEFNTFASAAVPVGENDWLEVRVDRAGSEVTMRHLDRMGLPQRRAMPGQVQQDEDAAADE